MNSRHPSDPHDHDDHIDEAEDNKGNRVDYKLPKPSIFKGEGAPQVPERGGGRFGRGPRGGLMRPEPYGNGHPFAGNGGERGNGDPQSRGPRPGRNRGGRGGQGGDGNRERGPRFGGQGGIEPGNRAPRFNPQGGQGGQGEPGNRAPRGEGQPQGPRPQGDGQPRGRRHGRGGRDNRDGQPRAPRPDLPAQAERPSAAQRPDETRIHGINACLAAFEARPDSIIRAYIANDVLHRFGYTMKFLAEQRRAYHVVDHAELERITESQHHGGVCFLVRKRVPLTLAEFIRLMEGRAQVRAVVLDGVGNPHNIGAILRSCAHFGIDGVLTMQPDAAQSGAAARVAEGGAEKVTLVEIPALSETYAALKAAGIATVVTSSHAEAADLYATDLPARCAFVVGAEGTGVVPEAVEAADLKLRIPGTGAVESLNVSVATGVVLAEAFRRSR